MIYRQKDAGIVGKPGDAGVGIACRYVTVTLASGRNANYINMKDS